MNTSTKSYEAICIRDAGKQAGLSQKQIFEWLEKNGWLFKKIATTKAVTNGFMTYDKVVVKRPGKDDLERFQSRVTYKGIQEIKRILGEENVKQ